MSRTIELTLTEEFVTLVTETWQLCGNKEVTRAIGFLAAWSWDATNKQRVKIYGRRDGTIQGQYLNDQGVETYEMLGIPDEVTGEYKFHS